MTRWLLVAAVWLTVSLVTAVFVGKVIAFGDQVSRRDSIGAP